VAWTAYRALRIHEAAHAVIAHHLGAKVLGISPEDDGGARAWVAPVDHRTGIIISLAGARAEQHYGDLENRPEVPWTHPSTGSQHDEQLARDHAYALCGDSTVAVEELIAGLRSEAEMIVNDSSVWTVIERVADAVPASGKLMGWDLFNVMDPKHNPFVRNPEDEGPN